LIKIVDSAFNLLAILKNVDNAILSEEINGEYNIKFNCVLDEKASNFVNENNIIFVDGQYFDITYYEKVKNADGTVLINVIGEHVTYRLNDDDLNFFTRASETPTQILTALLSSTDFSVGTVDFTSVITYSILEKASKRAILVTFAQYLGGELSFDGLEISILNRRGTVEPKLFTATKNLKVINKIYDRGVTKYDCEGVNIPSSRIALGDNVLLVDGDIEVKLDMRIVRYNYSPIDDMQVEFELANKIENVADTFYRIGTETVAKNAVYNGTRIGPDDGFVAERSDEKAKIVMNATEGLTVFTRDNISNPYNGNLTIDVDGNIVMSGKITLQSGSDVSSVGLGDLAFLDAVTETEITNDSISTAKIKANAVTANEINVATLSAISANLGTITAGSISSINLSSSTITGTTITIGTGNNVFKVTTSGIHLGHANFADAPFKVSVNGSLEARNALIDGQFLTTLNGEVVTELYADNTGGYIFINNPSGYRNIQVGSDPSNESGLLLIYNGGSDVFGDFESRRRVSLGVNSDDHGGIALEGLYGGNQKTHSVLYGFSAGGFLNIFNTNEKRVIQLASTTGTYNTGNLFLYDNNENLKARYGVNTINRTGVTQLYNSSGNVVVEEFISTTTDAGIMRVKNISGNTRVEIFCANESGQGGRITLFDTSGNTAVLRYNGTNLQVSKSGGSWINIA
jgi:hypothetical protein